jgi:hypothetical protein
LPDLEFDDWGFTPWKDRVPRMAPEYDVSQVLLVSTENPFKGLDPFLYLLFIVFQDLPFHRKEREMAPSASTKFDPNKDIPDLAGKVVIITGGK